MKYPLQVDQEEERKYTWEEMSIEDRYTRADNRAHINARVENMSNLFTNKAFDFYGGYVKIAEA